MADMTVTPETLQLGITLQAITLPGATHTESVLPLALDVQIKAPKIVPQFPTLTRKPNLNFRDEPMDNSVLVGDTASGYAVLNKTRTYNGRDFEFEMPAVPDADKVIYMDFYEANKDNDFSWYDNQDSTMYQVVFAGKPKCRLVGKGDLWNIVFHFRQISP